MFKIISDSSCDLTKEEINDLDVSYVPFKITIDGKEFIDDYDFNLNDFLTDMENTKNPITTSCPSPFDYMEEIEKNKDRDIYLVTISSKLSGSFNAAQVAAKEAKEKYPDINIGLIDSKSASAGQTRLVLKLLEYLKENNSFEETMDKITKYIDSQITMFVLESMQNLIKNGRIKKSAGLIANVLNIRPIMMSNDGEIELYEMNRGMKKSLDKLMLAIGKLNKNTENGVLSISHVNAKERAESFAQKARELYKFKDIVVRQTNGLSAGYADIGGIVIAF
ncbi:DegV family protein [Peptoniphilus lacrimalis]|uniref:DegV domain-containing protein SAV1425 n=1 Tax=Peptoniphilus lacrimalis TaxID=33031 RepID=A0A379C5X9_9FIRM|nr:DegV family protein [Peptoniphilus lacrimalis]SUB57017.1 DegV domain-containing protein SAV1425 [Peptoniphilus lacrimalis]